MARRKAAPTPQDTTTVYECWVSGNSYDNGVKQQFAHPIAKERRTGFGYLVRFDLTRPEARELSDIMAELALDISDKHGTTNSVVESIYRDLGKWPVEVRPC